MNESSNWQVAFVFLLFGVVCYAIARFAQHRREKALASAPAAPAVPDEPEHIALKRRQLAEAHLKAAEFSAIAEHSLAVTQMYLTRADRLAGELAEEESGALVSMFVGGVAFEPADRKGQS